MKLLLEIKSRIIQQERYEKRKAYLKDRAEKLKAKNLYIDEAIINQKVSYVDNKF